MTSEGTNMYMPVAPAYGYGGGNGNGNGWGGDGWWIILLLLLCGNGMWGGFGGGMMWPMMMGGMGAGMGLDYLYPWLNNSEHISDGFRDQQLQSSVTGIQNAVTTGFGNVQNALCQGFAGTTAAVTGAQNAIAQQLYGNEIANLNRSFAEQTANAQGMTALQAQLAQCCCDNRLATNDLRYTIATEECATRNNSTQNSHDIIDAQTRGTQAILDKLCSLELDNYRRENDQLRTQLNMANLAASQTAQTAELRASQATTANQLVNELRSCPIPSQPVYGNQPIFQCSGSAWNNNGCGCGCANVF